MSNLQTSKRARDLRKRLLYYKRQLEDGKIISVHKALIEEADKLFYIADDIVKLEAGLEIKEQINDQD